MNIQRSFYCEACKGEGADSFQTCRTCKGTGHLQASKGFFKMAQACHTCSGTGKTATSICKKCSGVGKTIKTEALNVKIPAGVDEGSIVKLKGMGNAGTGGGPAGDLLIEISIRKHPLFRRDGHDLYVQIPVTFGEAALGAKIEVPVIDGITMVKLPPGTQGGQRLKLSGKGFVSARTKHRGDEYVDIKIAVPRDIPEHAKDAVATIEALYTENPRKRLVKK